jgi:putative ABC transport system ATP-binding protein
MVIHIKNISKTYAGEVKCRALKDISLEIKKGDFVSIVGHSGSGKSTLLNCIAGLDMPERGEVVIDGMSIYDMTEDQRSVFRREYIGLIFQQYHLVPILSSEENVSIPLAFSNKKGVKEKSRKLLRKVGLVGKEKNIPSQLSGGECQRVAIARALINKPVIILADEPTGNLDSKNGKQIMKMLEELNKEGHTIVMVTHDDNCARYGNKIIRLGDGAVKSVHVVKK